MEENIKKDISRARAGELEVGAFIEKFFFRYFGELEHSEGYNPKGDLYSKKLKQYIEVKEDFMVDDTDNFFIEVNALLKTESPIWCFMDKGFYYFVRKEKLDAYIDNDSYPATYGGDGKRFKGKLIKRKNLWAMSKVYPRNWKEDEEWFKTYVLGGAL